MHRPEAPGAYVSAAVRVFAARFAALIILYHIPKKNGRAK